MEGGARASGHGRGTLELEDSPGGRGGTESTEIWWAAPTWWRQLLSSSTTKPGLGQAALEEADDIAARALSLRQDAPNALFVKGLIEIARERPALDRALTRMGLEPPETEAP